MAENSQISKWTILRPVLFRLSVYLTALIGCAFQSDFIGQDYFQYRTTNYLSILDSLPIIVPPTVTISFPYQAKHGISLKDLFVELKSNVTLNSSFVKPPDEQHHSVTSHNKKSLELETSYRIGTYQASLKTPANWSHTPSV